MASMIPSVSPLDPFWETPSECTTWGQTGTPFCRHIALSVRFSHRESSSRTLMASMVNRRSLEAVPWVPYPPWDDESSLERQSLGPSCGACHRNGPGGTHLHRLSLMRCQIRGLYDWKETLPKSRSGVTSTLKGLP